VFIGGVLNLVLGVPRLPSIPQTPAETRRYPLRRRATDHGGASRRVDFRAASNRDSNAGPTA
jgi:hypothetical protein